MVAGVPGTGIGGLYYVLLAMWMPFREIPRLLMHRSSPTRWKCIGVQTALAWGVVLALAGEFWLIERGLTYLHEQGGSNWITQHTLESGVAVAPVLAIAPFVVLGMVVLSLHVLRAVFRNDHPPGDR
jgi:hypothetical protein